MTVVRSLASGEGMLLKRLRLGALEESPDAFSPTYEDTVRNDDAYWEDAACRSAESDRFDILIAEYDAEPVGLVSGSIDEHEIGHIGMMWADPRVRGKGVGRALLERVLAYLAAADCRDVKLTVTETNARAIALYQSAGFVFTGHDVRLRDGSSLMNREMRLER